jgi:hypothetical protein
MERRLEGLFKFGGPLEKLEEVLDFEAFRSDIEDGLGFFFDRSKEGAPLMMLF